MLRDDKSNQATKLGNRITKFAQETYVSDVYIIYVSLKI